MEDCAHCHTYICRLSSFRPSHFNINGKDVHDKCAVAYCEAQGLPFLDAYKRKEVTQIWSDDTPLELCEPTGVDRGDFPNCHAGYPYRYEKPIPSRWG